MGGTGSTSIIYKSRCDEVDRADRGIAGEHTFASFEALKKGLMINYNRNSNQYYQILRKNDLKQILLTGYRIRVRIKKFGLYRSTKIVHRGVLSVVAGEKIINYEVPTRKYNEIKLFMEKIISGKFTVEISQDPIEEDFGSSLAGLDI